MVQCQCQVAGQGLKGRLFTSFVVPEPEQNYTKALT